MVCSLSGPMQARLDPRVNVILLSDQGGRLFRRIMYARQISKYCRKQRPAFLLCTLTYCNLTAAMAKVFGGIGSTQLLIREANSLANIRKASRITVFLNFTMMRWLYPQVDWVTANSDHTLKELETEIGVSVSKQALVRNPVLLRANDSVANRTEKIVLGCGRLLPQKDFATLIRAVASIQKTKPCRLVIIGEGPERANLEQLAESLQLSGESFQLPGFVDETEKYYREADVFVLPSKWEGLPNVVLEALSYGLPVVATDCSGGTREIFSEAPEAHLVAIGDVAAMAAKIIKFLEQAPEPEEMQAILAGKYDVNTIAASYCELAKTGNREA